MAPIAPHAALADLWAVGGGDTAALDHVVLTGADPILPSTFAVGTLAQATIAASALAAGELWHLRSGRRQQISVDMGHAAAEFRSERLMRVAGVTPADPWDKLAGLYRSGDGRWVRLHTNFPHHRDGMIALLGCANTREAVQAELLTWQGEAFENAAADRGLVATLHRSLDEWANHPQGQALAQLPLFEIIKIGDAPPQALPKGDRPLSGVTVLDLTRIIAGPVGTRTLAAHGADVLNITSPHLPAIPTLVMDTGRGKRSASIDLKTTDGQAMLTALARDADVFVQGYRPGGLSALGFSLDALTDTRAKGSAGIVYVSLSAYGHTGPWANRRGFDSLTQNANGLNHAEALAIGGDRPKELPAQALDHAAGYLIAFGAMMALHRRTTEGGSWHVRVSLAQTGEWLKRLGRIDTGHAAYDPTLDDIADLLETLASGFGSMTAVRHAAHLTETPARWVRPSVPLGTHEPIWRASSSASL
jgi:crotonobetainyl-CoA:carnitine CoA-transferase CaiB-like acyl-CoA transferase